MSSTAAGRALYQARHGKTPTTPAPAPDASPAGTTAPANEPGTAQPTGGSLAAGAALYRARHPQA